MSRITRERIEPGDALTSSDLNTRYGDYTQTDLNVDNAANPSFDQTQLPAGAVLINAAQGVVGKANDLAHGAPNTIAMATSAPALRTPVVGTLGTGGSGWPVDNGTLLRVYFNLQLRSVLPVSPAIDPHLAANMGALAFDGLHCSIGAHCWLLQLQWNLTSSALNPGDFVAVPGQGDFQSNWSSTGKSGEPVSSLAGTAAVPAYWAGSLNWSQFSNIIPFGGGEKRGNGWRNVAGSWVYAGTPALPGRTVYGFRLVVHGVYHPYNDGADNGLVLETAFPAGGIVFNYSLGNILAMHMRAD